MSWRRVASARPQPGGVARSFGRGPQVWLRARELGRALLDGFKQHDLLTYSSAISFQILTAVVPFVMFVLALGGLLHLDGVWRNHVAPEIRADVSPAVFSVISSAVNKVFSGRALLWATFGGGLALWQVSGAVRGDGSIRPDLRSKLRATLHQALPVLVRACDRGGRVLHSRRSVLGARAVLRGAPPGRGLGVFAFCGVSEPLIERPTFSHQA